MHLVFLLSAKKGNFLGKGEERKGEERNFGLCGGWCRPPPLHRELQKLDGVEVLHSAANRLGNS